jgi:hypothetical protein
MPTPTRIMSDRVKQVLLADGVKPESVSPYLAAWTWPSPAKPPPAFQLRPSGPTRPTPAEFIDFSAKTLRSSALVDVPSFREAGAASAHSGDPRFPDSQAREGPSWCQASSLLPIISALRLFLARALERGAYNDPTGRSIRSPIGPLQRARRCP